MFQSSQDPNWSTGELGSSCVISVAQPTRSSARRTLVLKTVFPSRDCFDLRVAAGILPKSSDERKRGEAFPQSRSVGQTKQSHLTWCIGAPGAPTSSHAFSSVAPARREGAVLCPWPSPFEAGICSDVIGTSPSGILAFGLAPQRIAPRSRALSY